MPHMPQECGVPVQSGAGVAPAGPAVEDANVENFFSSLAEPQLGHFVPSHLLERTKISLSFSHFPQ